MKPWRSPHDTVPSAASDGRPRALLLAIFFSLSALVVQLLGSFTTGSLSLLGDTAHVFTDLVSLVMAWTAVTLARRPVSDARSWGYFRLEVLASFVNGLLLAVVALKIVGEAWDRFSSPVEVPALPLITVAAAGLGLNLLSAWVLYRNLEGHHGHSHGSSCGHDQANHRHDRHEDRNLRAAMLHVVSDALGSVAVIAGGLFIHATGLPWIDPAIAVLLALAILWFSARVLFDSGHVLLEGTPRHVDVKDLLGWIRSADARVAAVEDLHVWEITSRMYALSVEVRVRETSLEAADQLRSALVTGLEEKFGIAHATVVVKPATSF